MHPVLSHEQIFEKAQRILVETLSVAPASVVPGARVIRDLGAESIDLLDLRFRIEKAFELHITKEDLAAAFGDSLENGEYLDRFTVGALCDYLERRLEQVRG
jgi:acyl carrier protein